MMYPWWVYPIIIGATVCVGALLVVIFMILAEKYVVRPFDRWLNK